MSATRYRVWVEEVRPPDELRFTWRTPEEYPLDRGAVAELVRNAVAGTPGVLSAELCDEALIVEIDPAQVSRYDVAATIRAALRPDDERLETVEEPLVRVWAEDLTKTEMRITWTLP
jgi:hypothetical protein